MQFVKPETIVSIDDINANASLTIGAVLLDCKVVTDKNVFLTDLQKYNIMNTYLTINSIYDRYTILDSVQSKRLGIPEKMYYVVIERGIKKPVKIEKFTEEQSKQVLFQCLFCIFQGNSKYGIEFGDIFGSIRFDRIDPNNLQFPISKDKFVLNTDIALYFQKPFTSNNSSAHHADDITFILKSVPTTITNTLFDLFKADVNKKDLAFGLPSSMAWGAETGLFHPYFKGIYVGESAVFSDLKHEPEWSKIEQTIKNTQIGIYNNIVEKLKNEFEAKLPDESAEKKKELEKLTLKYLKTAMPNIPSTNTVLQVYWTELMGIYNKVKEIQPKNWDYLPARFQKNGELLDIIDPKHASRYINGYPNSIVFDTLIILYMVDTILKNQFGSWKSNLTDYNDKSLGYDQEPNISTEKKLVLEFERVYSESETDILQAVDAINAITIDFATWQQNMKDIKINYDKFPANSKVSTAYMTKQNELDVLIGQWLKDGKIPDPSKEIGTQTGELRTYRNEYLGTKKNIFDTKIDELLVKEIENQRTWSTIEEAKTYVSKMLDIYRTRSDTVIKQKLVALKTELDAFMNKTLDTLPNDSLENAKKSLDLIVTYETKYPGNVTTIKFQETRDNLEKIIDGFLKIEYRDKGAVYITELDKKLAEINLDKTNHAKAEILFEQFKKIQDEFSALAKTYNNTSVRNKTTTEYFTDKEKVIDKKQIDAGAKIAEKKTRYNKDNTKYIATESEFTSFKETIKNATTLTDLGTLPAKPIPADYEDGSFEELVKDLIKEYDSIVILYKTKKTELEASASAEDIKRQEEKDKLAQEAADRLDKVQFERERFERERLQKEEAAKEEAEKQRLEQQKAQKEKEEKEAKEKEEAEKLAKEKVEKQRLEQETSVVEVSKPGYKYDKNTVQKLKKADMDIVWAQLQKEYGENNFKDAVNLLAERKKAIIDYFEKPAPKTEIKSTQSGTFPLLTDVLNLPVKEMKKVYFALLKEMGKKNIKTPALEETKKGMSAQLPEIYKSLDINNKISEDYEIIETDSTDIYNGFENEGKELLQMLQPNYNENSVKIVLDKLHQFNEAWKNIETKDLFDVKDCLIIGENLNQPKEMFHFTNINKFVAPSILMEHIEKFPYTITTGYENGEEFNNVVTTHVNMLMKIKK